MRKAWCLFALLLAFAVTVSAQNRADVFLGYSYLRANPGFGAPGFNFNGGNADVAVNLGPVFGVVADFAGYHTTSFGGANVYTYMFGPRVGFNRGPIRPFAQALFGGIHDPSFFFSATNSKEALAMAIGGGLDVGTKHVAYRVGEFDYVMTRFDTTGLGRVNQHNWRISSGVVFHF